MHQSFEASNNFLKHNSKVWWRPGRVYVPAWQLSGLDYEATTAADIKSAGTGTPSDVNLNIGEINTSGITGINMTTADNSVCHLMEVPADMDLSFPLYTYAYWTANNTSGTVNWIFFVKAFIPGTTVLGSAEASTAMSADGGAQTMAGVAYTLMRTPHSRLNGGALADTTEMLQIKVQMHALTTITSVALVGIALRYTPKLLHYGSMRAEAKPATYIASEKYAN